MKLSGPHAREAGHMAAMTKWKQILQTSILGKLGLKCSELKTTVSVLSRNPMFLKTTNT
jgi:hypothetical protein